MLSFPVSNLQSGGNCPGKRPDTVLPAGSCSSRPGCCLQNSPRHSWSPGPHCSIPVRTWKASPSPRVACWKGRDGRSEHKNPPAPTAGAAAGLPGLGFALVEPLRSQEAKTTPLGAAAPQLWPPPTHPPAGSDGDKPPVTLLISLCLSLLTISSRTSPSPLISLEDKDRATSCDSYCFRPSLCKNPSLFYLFMH